MAKHADIIDFRHHQKLAQPTIRRLLPELDGIEMLYTNDASDEIYSLKVLCWAVWSDGQVDGMVPWLNRMVACRTLDDPLHGHWEGYMDPMTGQILFSIPPHKEQFLRDSAKYYPFDDSTPPVIVQEVPDTIGSHAIFSADGFNSFSMEEIHSWRLYSDGSLLAMAVEESVRHDTPVLPGDECLYSVYHRKDFQYYFQHAIANKLKANDPDALAAMANLSRHRHT
ncbi:hypothetical protein [Bermanella sp. R86510]|uniref:hypothetical protein n=1 Tax=unclassified Bermanella TaxID=2627862 RepID=UPI0037CBF787